MPFYNQIGMSYIDRSAKPATTLSNELMKTTSHLYDVYIDRGLLKLAKYFCILRHFSTKSWNSNQYIELFIKTHTINKGDVLALEYEN